MILRQKSAELLLLLCICLSLFSSLSNAQIKEPTKQITPFDNLPARLFFFDDSTSAIYFDSMDGIVYVSEDEGRTWSAASGVDKGDAVMVIEHPFDNKFAFILTGGKEHYVTRDRGKSWLKFTVPVDLSMAARPLSFHSDEYGYILFQGTRCDGSGWGAVCWDETYYTKQAFSDTPQLLLQYTSRCQFAHSSKEFKHDAHKDLVYCVAKKPTEPSILVSSTDFFESNNKIEDLGIGSKNARGVIALAIVNKFAVVALKAPQSRDEMLLYVTVDTKTWSHAQFPHASSAKLRENAYTIVESTTHSLGVDVVLREGQTMGTLFVSNSNGTYFVQSLKDTNRNEMGYVDYERVYGVEGVGLANIVGNAGDVEGRRAEKQLQSRITFDDGRKWDPLRTDSRELHLHSVTTPHNFGRIFSSPAPGLVMGVGSVSPYLKPYEQCDTWLSTDAGLSWVNALKGPRKYEIGDSGSIIVAVDDEEATDLIDYSLDMGKTWHQYRMGVTLRARGLTTLPDSTSQKFLLVGQIARQDEHRKLGRYAVVFIDFYETRKRKCGESDFEKWEARPRDKECLMGHKQSYRRRKPDADCYVGDKFQDPEPETENCPCSDDDYECDFNFNRTPEGKCEPAGPEPVPEGVCVSPTDTYEGSSGYRKIPGNTCKGGVDKDKKIEKSCKQAQPPEGEVVHMTFDLPAKVEQHAYFKGSKTILVLTSNHEIWQSSNEGYSWLRVEPGHRFYAFYMHPHTDGRGYLITDEKQMFVTTDSGRLWTSMPVELPPNVFRLPVLRFQPESDNIIWIGARGCGGVSGDPEGNQGCHAEAYYSRDNGRNWDFIEKYVGSCGWAVDSKMRADPTEIICESYPEKSGDQPVGMGRRELIVGPGYYENPKRRQKIFESVVGFAKFNEFLVVAELHPSTNTLELQVSLDGIHFSPGVFPPSMRPETHAYTILESSTQALFLHMTTSDSPPYGAILKSNSNGTYFVVSLDNVNRNEAGFVDFEKIIGLDGIALVNVVSNADRPQARKELQTRITHNDGGTWKPLNRPEVDSLGQEYECNDAKCNLHIHGYTDRRDARATFSSPSIVGLIMAVGNIGHSLLPYDQCDTFLSRDGGFTWKEVRKDAHLWEFGDSGSILVMVNDEEATDVVLYSTDQGGSWKEYKFVEQGERKMRVRYLVTVPSDDSRKFILIGERAGGGGASVAVQVDFTALLTRQCELDPENGNYDDFELWSPSEERNEKCLFGRQTLYHRRLPNATCYVGDQSKYEMKFVENCACTDSDFECEFNHVRSPIDGTCILSPGAAPLDSDPSLCFSDSSDNDGHWYDRTAYRKIPHSTCEGGKRLDRGEEHMCPGLSGHGWGFWITMFVLLPMVFAGTVGLWFYRNNGMARGTIRLPGGDASRSGFRGSSSGGVLDTLASVPWFLLGIGQIAISWIAERVDDMRNSMGGGGGGGYGGRGYRGYRNVPIDEDAQVLRFEDED
ncbi:vacuolar protein sorting/targeting protein PEP1 [Marasmius crinis-equi]|uniref:Vacuolar protein sorting/targeting protein PEP1 n=1 Tax=Marasmius crinis-equi TaxID=585013 RepID=A0ABR3EY23_9AGAR